MSIILLIALVFIVAAGMYIAEGVGATRSRRRERLAQIGAYGFSGSVPAGPAESSLRFRDAVEALAARIGNRVANRLDSSRETEMRRMLYAAGLYDTSAAKFFGYRALATLVLSTFWIWISLAGSSGPLSALLGVAAAAAIGWVGPSFAVRRRATARLDRIDYELPELVDLLVTAVEGGLAFTAALQLASRSFDGPLGDELRLALQEQQMGLTTTEALTNLLGRIDTPAMHAFVQAIVQGESLGVSTGRILRDIASEMRSRRRHAAQERAYKAGVKIIFPLALLIFPALFVVVLGSALISILHGFSGG